MAPLPRTNQSGNDISAWHMLNISTHYQHICIFIYRDGTICLARLARNTEHAANAATPLIKTLSFYDTFFFFFSKLSFLFSQNEDPHILIISIINDFSKTFVH